MNLAHDPSARAKRISGPKKFLSSTEKDFFNTIDPKQMRWMAPAHGI